MVIANTSISTPTLKQSSQAQHAAEAEGRDLDVAIAGECRRIMATKPISPTRQNVLDVCRTMLTELDAGEHNGTGLIDWLRKQVGKVMLDRTDECAKFIEGNFPSLAARSFRHQDGAGWEFAVTRFIYSINDNCPDCGGRVIGSDLEGRECTDCDHRTDAVA